LLWRNRDDDFPAWMGRDLTTRNPTAQLAQLASDGATSATVAGEQLRQLHRLELLPTLATVTMGGNDLLAELNQALRRLAKEHRALVADVYGCFLGHGLAAGNPGQSDLHPPNHDLWYCGLIEPNAWGRQGDPSQLLEGPRHQW
jgi:lysophospholipase L1-like esterase